jgi:hypothetical protein
MSWVIFVLLNRQVFMLKSRDLDSFQNFILHSAFAGTAPMVGFQTANTLRARTGHKAKRQL